MIRKGVKMKLYDGRAEEYKRRHDALWEEMKEAIGRHGGTNYSIFLDEETNILFGYIELADEALWRQLADTEVCRRWWTYMADIMETNPDNSPVTLDLLPVFHLD